jgi:hypothetical protein
LQDAPPRVIPLFNLGEGVLGGADRDEVDAYKRVERLLESGEIAWVYVGP